MEELGWEAWPAGGTWAGGPCLPPPGCWQHTGRRWPGPALIGMPTGVGWTAPVPALRGGCCDSSQPVPFSVPTHSPAMAPGLTPPTQRSPELEAPHLFQLWPLVLCFVERVGQPLCLEEAQVGVVITEVEHMMRPQLPHLGNGDSDILSPIKLPDDEMRSL